MLLIRISNKIAQKGLFLRNKFLEIQFIFPKVVVTYYEAH